jgi:hypothetical protein
MSARVSHRVVERGTDHLLVPGEDVISGAEASRSAPLPRVGRRQLAQLRSAMSDRDLAVLRSLAACHYLQTRHVERLWFRDTGLTPLTAVRSSRRTLARLHRLGLIDRLERRVGGVRAGSASYVWTLTSLGARVLAERGRRRTYEPSLGRLEHVLEAAELVVRLHEAARDGRFEIISIETEPTCWRKFTGPHGPEWLKPDLRLVLAAGAHELHWFVEVDRGTEHRATLARKLETYVRAWRDGGEQRRSGVFPRVAWVAPDDRRQDLIDEVIRSAGLPDGMATTLVVDDAVNALGRGPLP